MRTVRTRLPRLSTGLLLVVGVLLLPACGADGPSEPGPRPTVRVLLPTGSFAGRPPKGLVVFVHGGGWQGPNPQNVRQLNQVAAPAWRGRGYAVIVPEYRAGEEGLDDVVAAIDTGRRRLGARVPICGVGESAGAHLLLEASIRRPALACVVSLAGPTDLAATERGDGLRRFAVAAFGRDGLERWSPAKHASQIRARVLQVAAERDPLVPVEQARLLERALPGTRTIVLPGGPTDGTPFIHSAVDPRPLAASQQAWAAFIVQTLKERTP
jgi:acetyl esterase/lipase